MYYKSCNRLIVFLIISLKKALVNAFLRIFITYYQNVCYFCAIRTVKYALQGLTAPFHILPHILYVQDQKNSQQFPKIFSEKIISLHLA